jgi:hypothetical protein
VVDDGRSGLDSATLGPATCRETYPEALPKPIGPMFSMHGDVEHELVKCGDEGVCDWLKTPARAVQAKGSQPWPLGTSQRAARK